MRETTAYLNRIATAVPEHDVHDAFVIFAEQMLANPRLRAVFRRMARRADIAHRYSFLNPQEGPGQFSSHDANGLYRLGSFPNTARRMELFERGVARFVRHDGPVSFRRAFRKEDWVRLLTAAEVPREAVTVEHWRPGRLCVGRWK